MADTSLVVKIRPDDMQPGTQVLAPDQGPASTHRLTLVFGATGYIGTHLVGRLLRDGAHVRASARSLSALQSRNWQGADLVASDALKPATLPAALEGVDTAYYLVHSMAAGRDFGALDLQAADNFAAAAAAAGVRRIVYLGGLIPADADSEHLTSRRDTGVRLRQGAVPVTEIRAGIVVGAGSAAYEVIRDLVNHLPFMLTPKWVQSKSAPIALHNLVEYLVRIPTIDEAAGQVLDAAGPDYLSYEEVMRQYGDAVGRRPRIVRVPLLTPTLSAHWLGLVTAVPANIARALIGGLKHDLPADDAALRRMVPQTLLSFRQSIQAALDAERTHTVAARWTEGLMMFRDFRIDNAFYAKRAGGSAVAQASPASMWQVVCSLGGSTGYFYMDWLWWLRGLVDWLVGGRGLTRGRRHPIKLRLGDRIDYWTVLGIEPGRRLTLQFGMRAPGSGVLELEVTPVSSTLQDVPAGDVTGCPACCITVTAYWHPQGVWGLLYWYTLVPAHLFIFKGMTTGMARRAKALERHSRGVGHAA